MKQFYLTKQINSLVSTILVLLGLKEENVGLTSTIRTSSINFDTRNRFRIYSFKAALVFMFLFTIGANAQTTYYSKANATSFSSLSSWGTSFDGTGAAPASISNANNFIVANGAALTLSADASVRTLAISSGSLTVSANTLTVSLASGNTSNLTINNGGYLTVNSGGTINVNGYFLQNAGGVFTQNGGTINVDGNSGVAGVTMTAGSSSGTTITVASTSGLAVNSVVSVTAGTGAFPAGTVVTNVLSATQFTVNNAPSTVLSGASVFATNSVTASNYLVALYGSPSTVFLNGGTLTIVDPHGNSNTMYSLYGNASVAMNANPNHTFKFGNGVSTDPGFGTNGFYIYLFPGSSYLVLGSVLVDNNVTATNNRHVTTLSNVGILGNLTVNSGGEYRVASTTYLAGNLVNNGTLTTTSALNFASYYNAVAQPSTTTQTISGSGLFRNATSGPTANFASLTVNNISAGGVVFSNANSLLSTGNTGSVSGTLTFTACRSGVDLSGGTFIQGVNATTPGTTSWTGGGFKNGTFKKWLNTATLGSTLPSTTVGNFPFVVNGANRNFQVASSASLATGGSISVSYLPTAGLASVTGTDGVFSYDKLSNSYWTVTPGDGLSATGTFTVNAGMEGVANLTSILSEPRLVQSATAGAGTHVAATGSATAPVANRNTLALSSATNFYVGVNSANIALVANAVYSVQNGNWNDATTWNTGVVPVSTDAVTITVGTTVAVDNAISTTACNALTIAINGTLNVTANTLNTNSTTALAGISMGAFGILNQSGGAIVVGASGTNRNFTLATAAAATSQLNISGGTLTVNGNLNVQSPSIFTQSAGTINVDGNAGGVAANSVASGTNIVTIGSPNLNLTGGTLRVVDPHANATAASLTTNRAFYYSGASNYNSGLGHTIEFGDGTSTDAGGYAAFGYVVNVAGSSRMSIGKLSINGSATGTNRMVSLAIATAVNSDITISGTTGELNLNALTLYAGGNLTNNGILTAGSGGVLYFGNYFNAVATSASIAQTLSGTGVFRNLATAATANFNSITINNNSATGVAFTGTGWNSTANATVSGTLTFTNGFLNVSGSSNGLTLGISGTAAGTLAYTAGGFTSGSLFRRWVATTAIAIPGVGGQFPFVNSNFQARHAYFGSATALATAGWVAVQLNDVIGTTPQSISDLYGVSSRSNSNWVVTTGGSLAVAVANDAQLRFRGDGIFTLATPTNFLAVGASASALGTSVIGTGTNTAPEANKTLLSTANVAQTYYVGTQNIIQSTATGGAWGDTASWAGGVVPTCSDVVLISNGATVTVTTETASTAGLTVNWGGTLTVSGGSLTVGCTNNNAPFINNGTLTISGGAVNVNGNMQISDNSNFTHSGGTITIDGNNGGVLGNLNSVASGTPLFAIGTSATSYGTSGGTSVSLTGGTIVVKDPHVGSATATSAYAVYGKLAAGVNVNASTAHTFQFGDGTSIDGGSSTSGFVYNGFVGTGRLNFGSVVVNPSFGVNRIVTQDAATNAINGNLTITSGILNIGALTLQIGGNISVNTNGHFITGTGTTSGTVSYGLTTGTTLAAQTTAQSVSITGNGTVRSNLTTAAVVAGGTGYAVGDVLTLSGGTLAAGANAAQFRVVSVNAGVITGVVSINAPNYSTAPTAASAVTGGAGSGCTLTLTNTAINANFVNIVMNNTSASGVTFNALNNQSGAAGFTGASVLNSITFNGNTSTTGSNALLYGTAIARGTGSVTLTSGGMTPGSTYAVGTTAAQTGTTITASTLPSSTSAGSYPFVDAAGNARYFFVGRTGTVAGTGIIGIKYTDVAGITSGLSYVDGAYTVTDQYNGYWSTNLYGTTPYGASTTFSVAASAVNAFGGASSTANMRLMNNTSFVGTYQAGTTLPHAQRTLLTSTQLTANPYYVGLNGADVPFVSIVTGNWEDASTWNKNAVPTSTDNVTISNGTTVTVNATAGVANSVVVNATGVLTVSGSTLTTTTTLTNIGTVNISGGALTTTTSITTNAGSNLNVTSGNITATTTATNSGAIAVSGGTLTATTSLTNNAASTLTVSSAGTVTVPLNGTFSNAGTLNANGGTINILAASGTGVTNSGTFNLAGSTINLGPQDNTACNRLFTNSSIFNMSSGTLIISGSLTHSGTNFSQSGGNIFIDPNAAGVPANSTSLNAFNVTGSGTNLTGGNFTFIDPSPNSAVYSIYYSGTVANSESTAAHTFVFGDGISSDAGVSGNGFYIGNYIGSYKLNFGSWIVNGPGTGTAASTNRKVIQTIYGTNALRGDLTINANGEFDANGYGLYFGGNITVNTGGIFTTGSSTFALCFQTGLSTLTPSTTAQTISGGGIIRNSSSAYTSAAGATSSSNTITVSTTTGLSVGMYVGVTAGVGAFAPGTYITSIVDATNFTTNVAPTTALSGGASILSGYTAGFTSLTVNNTNATGVTISTPIAVSSTLTMTSGLINTSSTGLLTLGTGTTSGTLSGTPSITNMIVGPFARTFAASRTGSGTYDNSTLFPVGRGTTYTPVFVDPTTASTGAVSISGEAFASNSGTAGPGVTNLSTPRWEVLTPIGYANLTSANVRISHSGIGSGQSLVQAPTAAGAYAGMNSGVSLYAAGPILTGSAISAAGLTATGYLAYATLTPCTAPADQPTAFVVSNLTGATFTGAFTAAASAPSSYLVVRYPSGGTVTNPVNYINYIAGNALGAGTVAYSGNALTFNAAGLTPGSTYDYYVYAFNSGACLGPVYNTVTPLLYSVTTCNIQPSGTPVGSGFTVTGGTISWTASSTAGVTYVLDVATNSTFTNFVSGYNGLDVGSVLSTTVSGLSANTTYYFRVHPSLSGCNGANSATLTVTTAYCTPTGGSSSTSYYLNSIAVTGANTNFSNTASSYTAYVNNTATSASQFPGGNFGLSLAAAGGSTYYYYCWIDWNGDFDFADAGETMVATTSYAATYSSSALVVPVGATIGDHRMRVAVSYSGIITACGPAPYGNYVDYTFTVTPLPTCFAPTALTATAITNTTATLGWTAPTQGTPTSYDYYYSTSSTAPVAGSTPTGNVASTSTSVNLTGLTLNTSYYYWVRSSCSTTDQSAWSLGGTFYTGACIPTSTYGSSSGFSGVINNVTFNNINHTTTGYLSSPYYVNYPTTTATTTVQQQVSYTMSVNTSGYNFVGAWFDWNNNLVFETTEFVTFTPNVQNTSGAWTASATVTVPSGSVLGDVRMRVSTEYYGYTLASSSACGPHTYGETKDYMITIAPTPTCYPVTAIAVSSITNNAASIAWTAPTLGTPASYEYEVRSSGAAGSGATGLAASGTTTVPTVSASITGLTANTIYKVYVRAFCGGSDYSLWTSSANFTTLCDAVSALPWTENFDSMTTIGSGIVPSCMATQTGSQAWFSSNAAYTSYNDPRSAPNYMTIHYGNTSPSYLWTPGFSLTAGQSVDFSFWYAGDGIAGYTGDVVYNNSASATGATALGTSFITSSYAAPSTYAEVKNTFIAPTTGVYYFGIKNTSTSSPWYMGIDDLKVDYTPTSISGFTPSTVCSNGGETITINGAEFTGATQVKFNGVNAASFTVVSNTQITAVTPAGVTTGPISVVGAHATGTSTGVLTVTNNPTVSAIVGGGGITCLPTTVQLTDGTPSGLWSTSNTSIATVNGNGLVTPVGSGTATITYTVSNSGCPTSVTTPVTVYMPPTVNNILTTASQTVVTNTNATFTTVATGTGLTYQWSVSTDGGTTFTTLANVAPYSGTTTNVLSITTVPASYNGNYYMCTVAGSSPCLTADTVPASLIVGDTGIATDPSGVALCNSGSATFTVVSSGTVVSYQWQEDQGLGYNNITNGTVNGVTYAGANSATLSLSGLTTANNGYNYSVIVTGPANGATSQNALLTVNQGVSFATNPTNQTVCYTGGSATFTANATGTVSNFQWQYSADGTTWANVVDATPVGVTYSGSTSGSLVVTTTAATPVSGTYYYRAVANASAPCTNVNSSSAQLIINNPTVTTQPAATTVVAGNTATYTVAATASTLPLTYQWQYSTNGTTGWANVVDATPVNSTYSGNTTNTLSVTMDAISTASTANYYRVIVTSGGCSVISNAGQMTVATYCTPAPTSQDGLGITNVTIGTINNTTVSESGYYGNYTSLSTDLNEGTTVPFSITYQTGYTYGTKIWIDFNKDGDFVDSGEQVYYGLSLSTNPTTLSGSFNLPIGTPTGVTRMRIGGTDTDLGGTPCYASSYGTFEDYTVNIVPAPACSGLPTAGTIVSSVANVCISGSATLTSSGYTSGVTGISFQWYNSAGAISGATSATYTTPVISSPETYYMRVTCVNGGSYADTNSVTVGVYNPSITATTPSTRCGTGTTTLAATGSAGSTLSWYAAATGGTALATGNSFTTPTISATTNYYVEANVGGTSGNAGVTGNATSNNGTSVGSHGIMFTTTVPNVKIVSVDVPFTGTGTMTIAVKNASASTVVSSVTTSTVTGNGLTPVTVPLDITIATPGSYTLIMTGVSGVGSLGYATGTYPSSALSGGFSVTNGYWYGSSTTNMYFFNLNVSNACPSPRTAVTATVTPAPALTISGSSAAICNGLATTTPVTVTSTLSDYDTYTWSPSTGVTGDTTTGYTFNPTSTTTYTLSATNATTGCGNTKPYTVTVNELPSAFTLSPASTTVCITDAPIALGAAPVNPTPAAGACTQMGNGQYPSSTYTPSTCDGTTVNSITTAGYAGEYSVVNVSASTVYTFSSSLSGDYVTIMDSTGTTVLAYGPSPVTWFATTATTVRLISVNSSCSTDSTSRTRGVICKAVDAAVFSPTTGLFTNAAGTTPYTGAAVTSVYADPTVDTTYTATVTNASGCVRTATASIVVNPVSVAGTATGSATICSGTNTTMSLSGYTGTIRWQQSANGTTGWTNITGATADTYTTANLTATTYYRARVTSGVCSVATSNVITIAIDPTSAAVMLSSNTAICSGSGITLSIGGVTGAIQWQQSADGSTGWSDISAATSATYATGNLTATNYYHAVVTSGVCPAFTTSSVRVQVNAYVTYYADADHDGYGNSAVTVSSCMGAPAGYVANSTDCDDTRANTHPGAVDLCNDGIDNDCNGVIDNVGQPGGCAPVVSYVIPSQCGTTLSLIDNQVYAALIANAQGYRWRVTKMVSGSPSTNPADIQMIDTSLRTLKLTQLVSYAFDTTYQIEIAVKINNNWQPYYGAACTITTPATTTTIVSTQCGTQLGLMTDVVYANLVSYASGYRFKVTNLSTSAVQTIDRSLREFRFNLLSNIPYNTLFKVEVAVKNTNGTYLPYGPSCNVTTPLFPTTSLQDSQCDYVAASNNELVYAKLVANATNYRFNFTNTALSYGYTFDTVLRVFALNTVPGLTPNTTYSVKVAVKIGGVWGPYNKICTLTTPGTVKPTTAVTGAETNFNATAYPNPFAANFKLNVTTTSAEALQVKVYDMLGKLIENSIIDPIQVRGLEVGNNYPSGVYNVIVSQGDNIKTLRVIKR
jgi:hypothetical protein